MASPNNPPKTMGAIIDRIEWIREELFMVQRSMEKMEFVEPVSSDGVGKKQ